MPAGTKITPRKRDVLAALQALEKLAQNHGFPDTPTVSLVGKTMRRLRDQANEINISKEALVNGHCKRDGENKPIPGAEPGTIMVEDPQEFLEALTALMNETCEVEIFPFRARSIGSSTGNGAGSGKPHTCTKCKQLVGFPGPEEYATLVDLGILLEGPVAPTAEEA